MLINRAQVSLEQILFQKSIKNIFYLLFNFFILSTYFRREELLSFKMCYHAANEEWSHHSTNMACMLYLALETSHSHVTYYSCQVTKSTFPPPQIQKRRRSPVPAAPHIPTKPPLKRQTSTIYLTVWATTRSKLRDRFSDLVREVILWGIRWCDVMSRVSWRHVTQVLWRLFWSCLTWA